MLTVCCVWVKANVPYGVEYVTRLKAMVARNLARQHRFVCLTDRPWELSEDIETLPIPGVESLFGWWAKIQLFAPGRFSGRVVYLDLDTLVVDALDPIVDFPSSFALLPTAGSFQPKTKHQVVKRFNSSVMVWDAGINSQLFTDWTPAVADRLWGDQDFIGEQWPHAGVMPASWFPRLSELNGEMPSPDAKVVLCKVPKNEEACRRYPWVNNIWRAA